MNRVRKSLALAVLVVGGVFAGNVSAAPVTVAKTCPAGFVRASLSWGVKCLHAGEFCKIGNREYGHYHFSCPATGHLRER